MRWVLVVDCLACISTVIEHAFGVDMMGHCGERIACQEMNRSLLGLCGVIGYLEAHYSVGVRVWRCDLTSYHLVFNVHDRKVFRNMPCWG